MKEKVVRALYDEDTITVYQAYNKTIAKHAVASQTFVCPPFKKERMTWIKPSFLWMMYRSGWGTKDKYVSASFYHIIERPWSVAIKVILLLVAIIHLTNKIVKPIGGIKSKRPIF